MKRTTKILLGVIVIVAVGIAGWYFTFQSKSGPDEMTKVKIAYLPIVQGLPLYLAIEKGYFKEEGIEVDAVRFDSPQLILNALIADQVDVGAPSTASGITGVVEFQKPGTLKVFALIGDDSTTTNYVLLVRNDNEIKSIDDLRGKKLGVIPGIQFRTLAKQILAQNGIQGEEEVTLVELAPGLQIQALGTHQVDALLTLEPARTIARIQNIGTELIQAPALKFVSDPFYGSVGVVRTKFIQENPGTTDKILKVFDRAINEIKHNPNESKQYLIGYTALDDNLIKEVPLPVFKMYTEFSPTDIEALQKWFDVFTTFGVITGKVDAKGIIYSGNIN